MVLRITNLRVQYRLPGQTITAVDRLDLDITAGRILGVVGESGSGKSTLALAIFRLIDPPGWISNGSILFEGEDLAAADERTMRRLRGASIALVMQNPGTALNPLMTIGRHYIEFLQQHAKMTLAEATTRSVDMLRSVELPDVEETMHRYPHQLSGGMKQRALIGMAMLHQPALLIADEPTSALDVSTQAQILKLFRILNRKFGTTIVLITHNLGVAAEICDDIAVLYAGRLVEVGSVFDVFDAPAHPYTQSLMRSVPRLRDEAFPLPIAGELTPSNRPERACVFQPRCDRAMPVCAQREPPAMTVGNRRSYCFLHEVDKAI